MQRACEGLAVARTQGCIGGRPPSLSPDQKNKVIRMRDVERRPPKEIASLFKTGRHTIMCVSDQA